ncbi:hypothetical protein LAC81_25765 [Ensifer adhaerens]|uniref:hypothetical protein n=1 Tax=Ensifer adhaerens TaxID=106592 RepID=UPI001CBC9DDB|nr:hypothetical protein [Ensifer adhaerens]MBZ7927764.1 hypothetical protein [Ensifer adhaerens]UAX96601.1 hypothetical protein LAC78_22720 [Ensifer adhaerens]UAY04055.1 hypothetical protein LAC80_22240 [Ensifer adhaerens]UAY12041.1 hypothetical protein LAC81_25765 [Ensifer adhaerens]
MKTKGFTAIAAMGLALALNGCTNDLGLSGESGSPENREERFKLEALAMSERRCEQSWKLLWPMAREGDGEALVDLANSMQLGGVLLPDRDTRFGNEEKQYANALALAVYGAAAPKHRSTLNMKIALQWAAGPHRITVVAPNENRMEYKIVNAVDPRSIEKLGICLERVDSAVAGERCVNQAMGLGIVPAFSVYREAVDRTIAQNSPKSCFRPYL